MAPWVVLPVFLFVTCFVTIMSADLSGVQRIALDFRRHLHPGLVVRSIYARFNGTNPIRVQFWEVDNHRPGDEVYIFRWGTVITPRRADGNPEVIDLPEDEWITIKDSYKMGLVNEVFPGPVAGYYDEDGSGVVLSLNKISELGQIENGTRIKFDDLELPFHIPLFPCNESQCPYYIANPPTLPPMTSSPNDDNTGIPSYYPAASTSDDDDILRSREMVIGLIIWNLSLTLCALLLGIAIVYVCADIERLEKRSRYQSQDSGSGLGIINRGSTGSKTELTEDVRRMRGEEEVQYYNLGVDPYMRSIERC